MCGECSAAAPRINGSTSAISSALRQALDAGHLIAGRAALDLGQSGQFLLGGRHDQLAELAEPYPALLAELPRHRGAPSAQRGLQASRLVVDAGVDDATVVAALMGGDVVFLFKDGDVDAGEADRQLARDRQAEDARPDDADRVQ